MRIADVAGHQGDHVRAPRNQASREHVGAIAERECGRLDLCPRRRRNSLSRAEGARHRRLGDPARRATSIEEARLCRCIARLFPYWAGFARYVADGFTLAYVVTLTQHRVRTPVRASVALGREGRCEEKLSVCCRFGKSGGVGAACGCSNRKRQFDGRRACNCGRGYPRRPRRNRRNGPAARRECQKVSIAIQAITAEGLARSGINDVTRLDLVVPGITFARYGADSKISLRGANSNNTFLDAAPTVGVFIDGIYRPSATQQTLSFFDVDRIEVLKGPQARFTAATRWPARSTS